MNQSHRLFWVYAGIVSLSAFTSAGFSIAALLTSTTEHVNALYGVSRSVSLAVAVIWVIGRRSPGGLLTLALIMTLVQAGDALIGGLLHDVTKTLGPAFLTVLTGVVSVTYGKKASKKEDGPEL